MAGAHRSPPPGEFGGDPTSAQEPDPAERPFDPVHETFDPVNHPDDPAAPPFDPARDTFAPADQPADRAGDPATRTAILDAASALFVERGYLATSIEDIAVAARVEMGTVYSTVGGKPQLLEAVVERFSDDPRLGRAVDEYTDLVDPNAIVRDAVRTNRFATEAFADFYDLIHRTVQLDNAVASGAEAAEQRLRRSLHLVALRLSELDVLRVTVAEAVDTFAYFLGHLSWRRLVVDFEWSYDDAEAWLADRIAEAVLNRGGAHR